MFEWNVGGVKIGVYGYTVKSAYKELIGIIKMCSL